MSLIESQRLGQLRIIARVLRKVEGLVEVADFLQSIARWFWRTFRLAIGSIVIRSRSRAIKLVIDACQPWQAKTALDEFQNRAILKEIPRHTAQPCIGRNTH